MQNYAIANNLTPFISMQNHYNLVYREEEREMFPTLKVGVAVVTRLVYTHVFIADVRCGEYSLVSTWSWSFDQTSGKTVPARRN